MPRRVRGEVLMTHIESKCPRCGILTLTTTAGNVEVPDVSPFASLAGIKVEIGDASDDTCRSCGYNPRPPGAGGPAARGDGAHLRRGGLALEQIGRLALERVGDRHEPLGLRPPLAGLELGHTGSRVAEIVGELLLRQAERDAAALHVVAESRTQIDRTLVARARRQPPMATARVTAHLGAAALALGRVVIHRGPAVSTAVRGRDR